MGCEQAERVLSILERGITAQRMHRLLVHARTVEIAHAQQLLNARNDVRLRTSAHAAMKPEPVRGMRVRMHRPQRAMPALQVPLTSGPSAFLRSRSAASHISAS